MSKGRPREAEIQIRVTLDDQSVPASIHWQASDAPSDAPQESSALLLSVWDPQAGNALSIHLWTPEMTVEEMNLFLLQTLIRTSESFRTATHQDELADLLDEFSRRLAEKVEELNRESGGPVSS